jgi:hypothetical protein
MPKQPLQGMLENVIEQFAAAIAERAQAMFAKNTRGAGKTGRGARGGVRMCPYPGCKNPGNGPRNRWFCSEHAKSVPVREQKRILAERNKSAGAALVLTRKRVGANKGKKLNMICRVEGCKNVSRGPRFGFICDDHRKKLSAKEQTAAREKWKAVHAKKAA